MQTIPAEELKKKLDAGEKPILLDVREPWEFSICQIEDSINISMSNPEKLINELNTDDEIIAICHHGMRSFQVCEFLEENGFKHVFLLGRYLDGRIMYIDPQVGKNGDQGKPIVESNPEHEISKIFLNFANKIKSTYL